MIGTRQVQLALRSTAHIAGLVPLQRSFIGRVAYSTPANQSPADYLASLKSQPENRAEADQEAKAWLEALEQVRNEFRPNGAKYEPSKVFAPEDSRGYNILDQVMHAPKKSAFTPTQEQIEQFEKLEHKAIPPMMDETMDYLANCIMRHGKKARAHRYLSEALYLVYLKTRQDPIAMLKDILDRMGPLVRLKRYSDGGARAELVPVPMSERQRLRQAWNWILESSDRRQSKAFSVRLSEEILAAHKGSSSGFDKRATQHRTAISNRAYISLLTK